MSRLLTALGLAVVMAGTTACVTGRREFELLVPTSVAVPAASKGTVSLGPFRDERPFQNKPRDPSVPSINGDVTTASPELLATLIGRQRNSYGMAMGDIALPDGQTIEATVRALLEEALRRRSYSVVAAGQSADALNVRIDEFWAWCKPGFAFVTFEAEVRTTLSGTLAGRPLALSVEGHGINKGQSGSDANWQLAYKRTFDDFLTKLDAALRAAEF